MKTEKKYLKRKVNSELKLDHQKTETKAWFVSTQMVTKRWKNTHQNAKGNGFTSQELSKRERELHFGNNGGSVPLQKTRGERGGIFLASK